MCLLTYVIIGFFHKMRSEAHGFESRRRHLLLHCDDGFFFFWLVRFCVREWVDNYALGGGSAIHVMFCHAFEWRVLVGRNELHMVGMVDGKHFDYVAFLHSRTYEYCTGR